MAWNTAWPFPRNCRDVSSICVLKTSTVPSNNEAGGARKEA
eukprot:CAMPEP_0198530644 /NCGR_PEP_ID=MMETSP1462-20131121/26480_1 /TAXON_ID=1333877 /ORGANISM="Brandtodinium nutriculum, Strain RCC3387" /LENGTH=40 /DNA_ID= /DNA_START= /DNA_END= /DNA_ORIENTATION=